MMPQAQAETPEPTTNTAGLVPDAAKTEALKPRIIDAIRAVYDPEIPVNIVEMGLIYDVFVDAGGVAAIRMTLTAPGCPVAQTVEGVTDARVDVVWEPAWTKDRMSDAAKLQLGMW